MLLRFEKCSEHKRVIQNPYTDVKAQKNLRKCPFYVVSKAISRGQLKEPSVRVTTGV